MGFQKGFSTQRDTLTQLKWALERSERDNWIFGLDHIQGAMGLTQETCMKCPTKTFLPRASANCGPRRVGTMSMTTLARRWGPKKTLTILLRFGPLGFRGIGLKVKVFWRTILSHCTGVPPLGPATWRRDESATDQASARRREHEGGGEKSRENTC